MADTLTVQKCYLAAVQSCTRPIKHVLIVASYESWMKLAERANISRPSAYLAAIMGQFAIQLVNNETFEEDVSKLCKIKIINALRGSFVGVLAIEENASKEIT